MDLSDIATALPGPLAAPDAPDSPGAPDAPALDALAGRLRALPPSCGPVRLVAVDGHAGSGKTTFAGRLAAALGGAPVLHTDDLATHEELFAWTGRLREQVLAPFARGAAARYAVYDWVERRFAADRRRLAPAPVVLIEGVGTGRRALRPYLARLLWMEVPDVESWRRGQLRDGPELSTFWDGWLPAERAHFAVDPSRPYAETLVVQRKEGYELQTGPAVAARTSPRPHTA
ncbi:uridine kinase family protein [Streptomyces milbemycinicus]|uniref:uridine kinase family protein n=1 Tax=Streptomyces milbemycinicus TaxID=476552 RepID=UPI0033FDFFFA